MGLRDEIGEQPDVVARLVARSAEIEAVARAVRDAPRRARRHRGPRHLGPRRDLRPVPVRDPAAAAGRAGGAVDRVALPRGAGVRAIAGDRHQPVGSLAGRRERRRRGAPPGPADDRDHERARVGARAAAEHVIDLGAGPERAVAATKTYTAELAAIALLVAALGGEDAPAAFAGIPAAIEAALGTEDAAREAAAAHAAWRVCTVLGRGYEYATAREWALKLKELARVVADPYSAADFRHGPLALVERGYPVLAVATSGAVAADLVMLLREIREDFGADLVVVSDREDVRAIGQRSIPVPAGVPDHLAPIVSIVPAQLFAYHATRARGLDPDAPRHISKVTLTT